jgi:Peptidase family M1 domain
LRYRLFVAGCWLSVGLGVGFAQSSSGGQSSSNPQSVTQPDTNKESQQQNATPEGANPAEPAPPKGTVLFERKAGEEPPPRESSSGVSESRPQQGAAVTVGERELTAADVQLSDEERDALTFVAYDLDMHLHPATAAMEMHARITVRNDGKAPLKRVAMQLSSSLKWERFTLAANGAEVPFGQHVLSTDADHTGQASEAILTLPQELAVGGTVELSTFYSGKVERSAARLEGIGAPVGEAAAADWDVISASGTALRGFGNVLWYPVASQQVFLGDGAALFQAVGRTKLRQQGAMVRLRLAVEYRGEAPKAAYFCGRMEPLTAMSENQDEAVASAPGVASTEFKGRVLGFRAPSLFVTDGPGRAAGGVAISAVTESDEALGVFGAAAQAVTPMLQDWIGEAPVGPLNVLDHPGQPFEDGRLLVTPMGATTDSSEVAGMLSHGLAHAWFESSHVWLNEGVAQFTSYLWLERTKGREVALEKVQGDAVPLAFAEPAPGKEAETGQSLIEARDEIYYRTKAAAVLWMLRGMAGDAALKQALKTYARETRSGKAEDAKEFQRVLEAASKKDLGWLFDDWVYRDRGLPDLSFESVTPRQMTAKDGKGGWLVAVVVHNAGDAAAEVPVTVRSGTLTATERVRVPGGQSVSLRVVFESDPQEVLLNDGSVPEAGTSVHVRQIKAAVQ